MMSPAGANCRPPRRRRPDCPVNLAIKQTKEKRDIGKFDFKKFNDPDAGPPDPTACTKTATPDIRDGRWMS